MQNKSGKTERGRASSKGKRLFFLIVGILLVGASVGLFAYSLTLWENSQSEKLVAQKITNASDGEDTPDFYYNDTAYNFKDSLETTLIFGIDKELDFVEEENDQEYASRNHQQADFLILVVQDKEAGTTRLLQLNRDTMTDVDVLGIFGDIVGTKKEQLTLSHTYGTGSNDSCRNVVNAVSNLLGGVPIDHYISLTMDAVAILNDDLGGVPVLVEEDFSQVDPTLIKGETVTLMGDQALTYVRARGSVDGKTNLERMVRQRKYLTSLYDKLGDLTSENGSGLTKLILDISPYMITDCSTSKLSDLFESAFGGVSKEIETIDGEAVKGEEFVEFYPDQDALNAKIVDLFCEPAAQ